MEGYRESIRQHFGDMEEDYIKVKGELKKLRFEHRVLQGQSSQELERVRTTLLVFLCRVAATAVDAAVLPVMLPLLSAAADELGGVRPALWDTCWQRVEES